MKTNNRCVVLGFVCVYDTHTMRNLLWLVDVSVRYIFDFCQCTINTTISEGIIVMPVKIG